MPCILDACIFTEYNIWKPYARKHNTEYIIYRGEARLIKVAYVTSCMKLHDPYYQVSPEEVAMELHLNSIMRNKYAFCLHSEVKKKSFFVIYFGSTAFR